MFSHFYGELRSLYRIFTVTHSVYKQNITIVITNRIYIYIYIYIASAKLTNP